jgi:hypothetical protein
MTDLTTGPTSTATSRADLLDDQLHIDTLLTALNTSLGPVVQAWEYDQLPGTHGNNGPVPPVHVLLAVERMYTAADRFAGGASSSIGIRASTRYVGTRVWEARAAGQRVTAAFEDQAIPLGATGLYACPVFESATDIDEDDGMYSGLSTWTYLVLL